MTTGMTQKSKKLYFHCGPLAKDIKINKINHPAE